MLAATHGWWEKGQHCMPSKGIRKRIIVQGVEGKAGDETRVEGKRHGRRNGANELRRDSRILAKSKSFLNLSIIQLSGELVLNLVSRTRGAELPIVIRHGKARRKRGNACANGISDVSGEGQIKKIKKLEDAWRTFHPRREMSDL